MRKKMPSIISFVELIVILAAGLTACSNSNAQTLPAGNGASAEIANSPAYTAEVGGTIQIGGLDWRVLEVKDGKALILADEILLEQRYHSASAETTWEECELRQYLNGEFYDATFSTEEKGRIVATAVQNKDNPWYLMPGGNDTTDKVFLLSIDEAVQYFGDSGGLSNWKVGATSLSDQFNEARIAQTQAGGDESWWLRSPGLTYNTCEEAYGCITAIAMDGSINMSGNFVTAKDGVRPALWLKL